MIYLIEILPEGKFVGNVVGFPVGGAGEFQQGMKMNLEKNVHIEKAGNTKHKLSVSIEIMAEDV